MPQFPLLAGHFCSNVCFVHVLVSRNTECWEGVRCGCCGYLLMPLSVANPVTQPHPSFWAELANMQSCSFPDRQIPERTVFVRMQTYFLDSVVRIH